MQSGDVFTDGVLGAAVFALFRQGYEKRSGKRIDRIYAGDPPPAVGRVVSCVCVVWLRSTWRESVEVFKRREHRNADAAAEWSGRVESRLARRDDVLIAGTLHFHSGHDAPGNAAVVDRFRTLMENAR